MFCSGVVGLPTSSCPVKKTQVGYFSKVGSELFLTPLPLKDLLPRPLSPRSSL